VQFAPAPDRSTALGIRLPLSKIVMSKEQEGTGASRELPERWSVQQRTDVVLRLLRGEDLGELSREIQVPAHEIEE
jgi:hypothetical protein